MNNENDVINGLEDDEKELDSIFEHTKNNQLHRAVKKAKWRSTLRTIAISLVALGVVGGMANWVGRELMTKEMVHLSGALMRYYAIAAPDAHIGMQNRIEGNFGGKTLYTSFKLINGKVVYAGQKEYSYGPIPPVNNSTEMPSIIGTSYTTDDIKKQTYNELGQRQMIFYYPFIEYPTYKNDLKILDSIDRNLYIEMALSFDQAYTMDQVQSLMPKGTSISWYWVDDLNQAEKEMKRPTDEKPAGVQSENTAYGIKTLDDNGDPIQEPEQFFLTSLNLAYKEKDDLKSDNFHSAVLKNEFNRVYKNIAGSDDKLTIEDVKIQGVVVIGDANTLEKLRGLPFIKASSLGVVTEKY